MRPGRIALAAGATWCAPALAPHVRAMCGPLRISRTLPPTGGDVALTFDDGPHPVGTPGRRIARRQGWEPMLWSKWGTDWRKFISPRTIAQRVTTGVIGGDVLLLHDADHYSAKDSHLRTAAALPFVLDELERRGLRS